MALALGCGGDATPQYAMVIDEDVVTVGSRDGRTTLSSGEWTGTIDGGDGSDAIGRVKTRQGAFLPSLLSLL